jgi:hypothetical protein
VLRAVSAWGERLQRAMAAAVDRIVRLRRLKRLDSIDRVRTPTHACERDRCNQSAQGRRKKTAGQHSDCRASDSKLEREGAMDRDAMVKNNDGGCVTELNAHN